MDSLKYLSSQVNYLSITEAAALQHKGWVVWLYPDGTWSAVWLVNKPVQPGQAPWIGKQ